ncbi:MAG TPA: hypothetical protein VK996_06555, partial [Ramlibacter sp.]|nr:hypothetical protein [Ramlibacter sp.]
YAGPLLDKYFQSGNGSEIGSGQISSKLVSLFAPSSMTVTAGLTDTDTQASLRNDACKFVDERLSDAQKVAFMHELLKRDAAEVRMFLEHLERYATSLGQAQRVAPKTALAFAAITNDPATRDRYLVFARDADEPTTRVRMMAFARNIGWLSPAQEHAEFVRMIEDQIARDRVGRGEVDLACARNAEGEPNPALQRLTAGVIKSGKVAPAAMLACTGNTEARARVVRALTSANADDIAIAQAYLRHRPLADINELRTVTTAIARMPASSAQVRALDTLAQHRLADAESLREIARLYPLTKSVDVQRAIAGILIRSDHRVLGQTDLARSLKQHRLKSPDGDDVIDALIRVLQSS